MAPEKGRVVTCPVDTWDQALYQALDNSKFFRRKYRVYAVVDECKIRHWMYERIRDT